MTFNDACNRLPAYLAGELAAAERSEIERLLATDPELQRLAVFSRQLEKALAAPVWLEPSPDFTARVMAQVRAVPAAVPMRVLLWDRIKTWLSLAALLPLLIFYGRPAMHWALVQLQLTGNWLDSLTGYTLFGLHPMVVLGLFAPLAAGAFATCVLSGRCRLSS